MKRALRFEHLLRDFELAWLAIVDVKVPALELTIEQPQELRVLIWSEGLHGLEELDRFWISDLDGVHFSRVDIGVHDGERDLLGGVTLGEVLLEINSGEVGKLLDGALQSVVNHWVHVPGLASIQGFGLSRENESLFATAERLGDV